MDRVPRSAKPSARTAIAIVLAATVGLVASAARGQTPVGVQPTLPQPVAAPKASPVVDTIAESRPPLVVRKTASAHAVRSAHRHYAHHRYHSPIDVERPALAGVLLVEPIPPRPEAPRPIVPMPAYFVDGIASAFTTPPPPVVCERRRPDPQLPDPRLYREVPLACGSDID